MKPFKIAVIPGDGIGVEVVAEGLKVARAAGAGLDVTEYDLGGRRYLATGEVLPDSVREALLAGTMALVAAGFSMRATRRGGVARMIASGVAAGFALFVTSKVAEEFGQSGARTVSFRGDRLSLRRSHF